MSITVEHDGKVIEFPDEATANQFFSQQPSQKTQKAVGQLDGGTLAMAKFAQGLPFVGEYVDDAFDFLLPETDKKAGGGAILRAAQSKADETMPKTAIGSQIGGGILGSLPAMSGRVGAGLTNLVMSGASRGGQVLRGGAVAGGLGALEGGIAGAGRQQGEGRAANAKDGAIVGGLLGTGLGVAGPVVGDAVKSAMIQLKGSGTKAVQDALGVSSEAAELIKQALDGDDLDAAIVALKRSGAEGMLMDASPATRSLAQAASKSGGPAQSIISRAVEGRVDRAGTSLLNQLDDSLGAPPTGLLGAAEEISQRTAPQRKAAYDAAFAEAIDYASPQGRAVEETLSRIPKQTLGKAIRQANERMTWQGSPNKQILADIAEDGSATFREMPNVEQLNQLKIELDNIGRANSDVFGRPNPDGMLAKDMARGVKGVTVDAVPKYGDALKIGGDKIRMDQALEIGSKMLRGNSVTREDVIRQLAGAPVDERAAAKAGVRMYIDEALSNIRAVASDPNIEARQLNKAWQDLSSPSSRQKIEIILGKPEAEKVFKQLGESEMALGARAAVSRNSDTAINQRIQLAADQLTEGGVVDRVMRGEGIDAVKALAQSITGAGDAAQQARKADLFKEIAEVLTKADGKTSAAALNYVKQGIEGASLTEAQASLIAGAVRRSSGLAAYQVGKPQLTK